MKSIHVILAIVCTAALFSCKKDLNGSGNVVTRQRQPGNFTAVTSKGDFRVVLKKGPTAAVELTGEDNVLEKVVTETVNSMLTIKYADGIKTHKNKQVTVNVTLPVFSTLRLEGSGVILAQESWNVPDLAAYINGSGNIELAADGTNFHGEINGSGKLKLNGSYQASDFNVNGSGAVNAFSFSANTAEVKIDGSGKCELKVNNKLKVRISGSGHVYYKGNPDTNVTVSGSGKAEKVS